VARSQANPSASRKPSTAPVASWRLRALSPAPGPRLGEVTLRDGRWGNVVAMSRTGDEPCVDVGMCGSFEPFGPSLVGCSDHEDQCPARASADRSDQYCHRGLVRWAWCGLSKGMAVPDADECREFPRFVPVIADQLFDTFDAVVEMDFGKETVRGRAGDVVDPNAAAGVVDLT
jgi:hypothetical protein